LEGENSVYHDGHGNERLQSLRRVRGLQQKKNPDDIMQMVQGMSRAYAVAKLLLAASGLYRDSIFSPMGHDAYSALPMHAFTQLSTKSLVGS
jgi:hypothetical protein